MLEFIVAAGEHDQTIISFLKRKLKSSPLSLIYKLFRTKKIKINDQSVRYYHLRLQKNDRVIVDDKKVKEVPHKFTLPSKPSLDLNVFYEDENILLILKGHNVEMQRDGDKNCLNNIVQYYLYKCNPSQYLEQARNFFIPVALHQLDKLTKGLVIYAKNSVAKRILYSCISDKSKIAKSYLAVCGNNRQVKLPSLIKGWIVKNEKKQKMEFYLDKPTNCPNSKFCALEASKLFQKNNYQFFKIILITGRKHQIRASLAFFDIPIAGDVKYGSKVKLVNKIYLFAYQIKFNNLPHPLAYLNNRTFKANILDIY